MVNFAVILCTAAWGLCWLCAVGLACICCSTCQLAALLAAQEWQELLADLTTGSCHKESCMLV
jgi:hypothetical protein